MEAEKIRDRERRKDFESMGKLSLPWTFNVNLI